jgi:hypothetical protein
MTDLKRGKDLYTIWQPILFVFLLLGLLALSSFAVRAQPAAEGWSEPILLFQTSGHVYWPTIASDPMGAVHVLWSYRPSEDDQEGSTIYYTRWDGRSWSEPNDVLTSPGGGGANGPRATIDHNGMLHVIWSGPNNALYYSSAHASQAGSARAWIPPRAIGSSFGEADILADASGTLHVAYPQGGEPSTLFYINSPDGGGTWSHPVQVFNTAGQEAIPLQARLAVDGRGRIHMTWWLNQLPDGWPPLGAFYARSTDGGRTWSDALQFAEKDHGQPGIAAIGDDLVHLVWRSRAGGDGTWHQWSSDGGQTWSAPVRFDTYSGFSGPQALAVDSAGTLHFISSSVNYNYWTGSNWAYSPRSVDLIPVQATGGGGQTAQVAVSEGNVLHVVYETGTAIGYLTRRTSAPHIPPQPLPTPASTLTPPPASTGVAISSTPTLTVRAWPAGAKVEPVATSPAFPLLAGLLPAALLVGIVILVRIARLGQR